MQVNGFKKSLFGLKKTEVLSYLDTLAKDLETKIRNKDDDIRELKKELSDKKDQLKALAEELEQQKKSCEEQLQAQKAEFSEKTEQLKAEFSKEKEALSEKLNDLKLQFTVEKEKIGRALVSAEETANAIIADANVAAEQLIAEAKRKADIEKERYKKSKADVSDFTYDIKRLMEKLTADLKERLD